MKPPRAARSRSLAAVALVASLVAVGCASAAPGDEPAGETSSYARPGVYLGVYGIKAYENFDTGDSRIHTGDSDLGAGLKLGFRATPCVAVEVLAENVKGFDIDDGAVDTNLDILNFGIAGKYFLMHDQFQPYLIAGVGIARPDVRDFDFDDDSWFMRGGVGIDVYLTSNFAVFGEVDYNRMMGGGSDLHHVDGQVGLLFRF